MSVNKVMLMGRLGSDPELKQTPNGNSVCSFSLATTEKWKGKDGQKQEKTEWHKIVIWGKLAGVCAQYLGKGSQCFLEGKNATRSWEDKDDGKKRYMTEVIASNVVFLSKKKDEQTGEQTEDTNQEFNEEDIPF